MKVVHISTGYNHGGAAIACRRLVEAQRQAGIDARIITQERGNFPDYVTSTTKNFIDQKLNILRLAWEKLIYLFFQSSGKYRFQYSLANTGINLSGHKWILEADIIHLHWINGGFISLKGLRSFKYIGKPIVWTMHDVWPFTGGCHIAGNCLNFQVSCKGCFYLHNNRFNFLSNFQHNKKRNLYKLLNINFISPSENHKKRASTSSLLKEEKIVIIPNIIQSKSINHTKQECRNLLQISQDKIIICFGAYNISSEHKGMKFMINALKQIKNKESIELLYFGKRSSAFDNLKYKIHYGGFSFDEEYINLIYKAADVFVSPSTEESFGLTVAEAMLVGTPVVSFDETGVKDIIDHKINGYLAENKNTVDLVNGIEWCLQNNLKNDLSKAAIQKITAEYNSEIIANKYINYYKKILET